jgi:hypothetical protein
MRTKLKYMLDIWMDGGFVVQLTLSTGAVISGRLKETDTDEVILEPDVHGRPGPLTVVQLAHVVAATYIDVASDIVDASRPGFVG